MKEKFKKFAVLTVLLWIISFVFCLMLMSLDFIYDFEFNYLPIIRLALGILLNGSFVYVFALMFVEKSRE